jgi:hypothetical protein
MGTVFNIYGPYCYTWNMPVLLPSKVFSRNGIP